MAMTPHVVWRKKLDRIRDDQLQDLLINREIFRQANKVWQNCEDKSTAGYLASWMAQNYVAFAATAIRRTAEPKPKRPRKGERTLSLVILLEEMKDQNHWLSRQWYIGMYRDTAIRNRFADEDFDKLSGSPSSKIFPKRRISKDIKDIRRAIQPIKRLTDKVIAHTEEDRRKIGSQRWGMIDDAVDVLVKVFQRYYLLLNASDYNLGSIAENIDVSHHLKKIWP